MSIHDGHRSRFKDSFLKHGLDSFDELHALELLLFYSRPRGDVNPLAHKLMGKYKTLAKLFDAPIEDLMQIDGVGENTAILLKLVPQIYRRYVISRNRADVILDSSAKIGNYFAPYFIGERDEVVYMMCMDSKRKLLDCRMLCRGNINSASVNIRQMVMTAVNTNATCVAIAHNHISDIALPSPEDMRTTDQIRNALSVMGISLVDHIIVASDDFVSMADSFIDFNKHGGNYNA